jgi:PKD repeat protein
MWRGNSRSVAAGLLAAFVALPSSVAAGSVTVAWNANPEANVSYVVGYGTMQGRPTWSIDVGTALTATITNLVDGQLYYFVVYANVQGAISQSSNEVSAVPQAVAPSSTSATSSSPALTPSPSGTRTPPAAQIVDDALAVWTIGTGGQILRNGVSAAGGLGSQILWYQGRVYVLGTNSAWWQWMDGSWASAGPNDPAGTAPSAPVLSQVVVSSVAALQSAVDGLTSGTTIVIQPGTYRLTKALRIGNGVSNVALVGSTTNRDHVVIYGSGMNATSGVAIAVTVENAQDVRIANLSIGETAQHAIQLVGDSGADRVSIENVRLFDSGRQFLVSTVNAQNLNGVDDVAVEGSLIEYTAIGPASGNTEGISVYHGARWRIRQNTFRNIHVPASASVKNRPAILMQSGSRDTIVDANLFVNCERSVVFGIGPQAGFTNSHSNGSIYNNVIWRNEAVNAHVGISVADSPGTQVLHNTVVHNGTYADAIEYRYASTTGVTIANNLTDGTIRSRDNAQGSVAANYTQAGASLFVNAPGGDLHLAPTAWQAIDQGLLSADVVTDWDGEARPLGAAPDLGADETALANQPPIAAAGASVTSGTAPLPVAFTSAGSGDPEGQPFMLSWEFGDGTKGSGASPSHTYASPGTFDVTLTVQDAGGATATSRLTIVVTAPKVLNPPTDLRASVNKARVDLAWTDRAAGESGYAVERALVTSAQLSYQRIATLPANAQAFTDGNAERKRRYRYRVAILDGSGNVAAYSNWIEVNTR